VLALAGVVTLALIAGVVLRSVAQRQSGLRAALGAGGKSPAGVLEVLGRYPVARGATLVLLKLDRRVLLLSQTAGGRLGWTGGSGGAAFSTLCEVIDPDEVASILVKTRDADGESMAERFRTLLTGFDRGMDAPSAGGVGIPVVDLTRREAGPVSALRRRLDSIRKGGNGR
jgi:hypothetical protein